MGCSKGNLQTDGELRVGYNAGMGMVKELAMVQEWAGVVKRDMSVVG